MNDRKPAASPRLRVTVVLGRGRHAAEAARLHRGSIECDARGALREWACHSDERFGEQFCSDTGRTLGAMIYFDFTEGCDAVLAELDAALAQRLLERLRTRIGEAATAHGVPRAAQPA
jgi:hypothetical protein